MGTYCSDVWKTFCVCWEIHLQTCSWIQVGSLSWFQNHLEQLVTSLDYLRPATTFKTQTSNFETVFLQSSLFLSTSQSKYKHVCFDSQWRKLQNAFWTFVETFVTRTMKSTHTFPACFLRFQVGALRVKTSIQIISQHGVSLTAIKLQVRGIYPLNNTGSRCLEGV